MVLRNRQVGHGTNGSVPGGSGVGRMPCTAGGGGTSDKDGAAAFLLGRTTADELPEALMATVAAQEHRVGE
jgi:hypothetical protein